MKLKNNYLIFTVLIMFSASCSKGPQGDPGPQGLIGITGATGATGPAGANGSTIGYGTTAPTTSTGNNGDFYINTSTDFIYGPKANGAWPTGISLIGPQGAMGAPGANGNTIDYGTTAPTATTGNNGDFYINTATNYIYGPKANGIWPMGVSIIGPQGISGAPIDSTSVGIVAFWKFEGNANDASGNGHNGMAMGGVASTYDRFGRAGGAFYFDGTGGSYVSVPNSSALQLTGTDYTINFWIKMQSFKNLYPGALSTVVYSSIISNGGGYSVGIGGNYNGPNNAGTAPFSQGVIYASTQGDLAATTPYVDAIYALDLNDWHMITVVYTKANSTIRLFIDGYYNSYAVNLGAVLSNNPNPLYIGVQGGLTPLGIEGGAGGFSTFLNATLDDIRIYNQAISVTRILQLKNDTSNE